MHAERHKRLKVKFVNDSMAFRKHEGERERDGRNAYLFGEVFSEIGQKAVFKSMTLYSTFDIKREYTYIMCALLSPLRFKVLNI